MVSKFYSDIFAVTDKGCLLYHANQFCARKLG